MLIIDRNTAEWKMAEYNKPNQKYVYMLLHGEEIKIGLNNRELGKLWSRYKTVHANFKAYIVRVDDSAVVEKAIHTALKTRGLHLTNELFKNCVETREVFKRITQMFDKDDVQDLKHIGSVARPYHNNNQNTNENHAEKLAKIEIKKETERREMERREAEEKAQIREAEEKAAEWGRMRERNIRDEERKRRRDETERQIQRLIDERREADEEDDRREAELREQEKKAKRREEERREAEKRAKRRNYENVSFEPMSFEPTSFVKLNKDDEWQRSCDEKSKEDARRAEVDYKRYVSKPDELKKHLDNSMEKLNKYGDNFERKTKSNIRF